MTTETLTTNQLIELTDLAKRYENLEYRLNQLADAVADLQKNITRKTATRDGRHITNYAECVETAESALTAQADECEYIGINPDLITKVATGQIRNEDLLPKN